ncbi:MAG: hypothetical protein CMJ64_26205 [Planctomycetaceae bacterium]|nr:hypothetical protein [Planctomycetaceae bacterium]
MWRWILLTLLIPLLTVHQAASEEIEIDTVVTVLKEIKVPAREAGILATMSIRAGDTVTAGRILGRLDETRPKLVRDQAQLELTNAKRLAENDLKVRLARKTYEVAAAELKRATDSADRFAKSVSKTELDQLRLKSEEASLQIDQSQFEFETAQLSVQAKQAALQIAEHDVKRRTLVAPAHGMIVEILTQVGEWVEPGAPVLRMVYLDRLRVEGFVDAARASSNLVGQTVSVSIKLGDEETHDMKGKLTFVSPEIHPVNGMVRIWAEIDNKKGLLRPGLQASMKLEL